MATTSRFFTALKAVPSLSAAASSSSSAAASSAAAASSSTLSDEQSEVVRRITTLKDSIYVPGVAGTGKSHTLRAVRESLEDNFVAFGVTAMTGLAGSNIGGTTLHMFLGIEDGSASVDELARKIMQYPAKRQQLLNIRNTKLLIIDEISMMSAVLWEKIDTLLQRVRGVPKPMGGMIVLALGDFAQLPPVFCNKPGSTAKLDKRLVFQSPVWNAMFPPSNVIPLTRIFRQQDAKLIQLLSELRLGRVSAESLAIIRSCKRELQVKAGIEPTILYAKKVDVDRMNQERLDALPGSAKRFTAVDLVQDPAYQKDPKKVDGLFQVRRQLDLKVDAQVMLIANRPDLDLVNGSRGRVSALHYDGSVTVMFLNAGEHRFKPEIFEVKTNGRDLVARRTQLPFTLAWACTIHKSQGMTLDYAKMDLENCFETGQVYVGVSRIRSLDGLQINSFSSYAARADARVLEWFNRAEIKTIKPDAKPVVAAAAAMAVSHKRPRYEFEENSEEEQEERVQMTDTQVLEWFAQKHATTAAAVRALAMKQ